MMRSGHRADACDVVPEVPISTPAIRAGVRQVAAVFTVEWLSLLVWFVKHVSELLGSVDSAVGE
jgi:hypothetical protein